MAGPDSVNTRLTERRRGRIIGAMHTHQLILFFNRRLAPTTIIGLLAGTLVCGLPDAAGALTVTGFGGVMTTDARDYAYTTGVALFVVNGAEFEVGALLSEPSGAPTDWYGQVGFRFFAPRRQFSVLLPYIAFGAGFRGQTRTQNIGIGMNLGILRADYRFIWDQSFRAGHHRAYVGLEFRFGQYP
jgi:hypothetical protein